MPRLPTPGSDGGQWGDILNQYLSVEHNSDGTLKASGTIGDKASTSNPTFTGSVTVPTPTNATDAATKDYVDSQASSGAPDATTSTKGIVQLTGDLSGTATNPQIATGAISNSHINSSASIAQSKVANLTTDLASKASTTHTHTISDTTNLQTTLDSKVSNTTTVNGQALSSNITLDPDDLDDTSTTNKFMTSSEKTKLSGIATGAEANVNADWNSASGDSQILNKPTIPSVASDVGAVANVKDATGLWHGTESEYAAIGTPNANTVYVVVAD